MWASNCVYFLSFLCPTQSPQSSALCSGPSWKFLFSWTRGQDCPCWADFIPPDLTMDELCCYINIYFSHVSPPPFFTVTLITSLWANQQQEERGCALLSVWDIAGFVLLTSGCHDSLWLCILCERSLCYIPFISGLQASLPIFVCALLKLCIHEKQIRYLAPSCIYTASGTFCAYILTSLCEWQAVVYTQVYLQAACVEGATYFSPFTNTIYAWICVTSGRRVISCFILIVCGRLLFPHCLQLGPFQVFCSYASLPKYLTMEEFIVILCQDIQNNRRATDKLQWALLLSLKTSFCALCSWWISPP